MLAAEQGHVQTVLKLLAHPGIERNRRSIVRNSLYFCVFAAGIMETMPLLLAFVNSMCIDGLHYISLFMLPSYHCLER